MSRWALLMTCIVLAGFFKIVRIGTREAVLYEFRNVAVEQTGEYEYWLTPEHKDRFHTTVCKDYAEPGFTTGMILRKVIFVDRGSCWSLDPNQHAGYYIERDEHGQPILISRR